MRQLGLLLDLLSFLDQLLDLLLLREDLQLNHLPIGHVLELMILLNHTGLLPLSLLALQQLLLQERARLRVYLRDVLLLRHSLRGSLRRGPLHKRRPFRA